MEDLTPSEKRLATMALKKKVDEKKTTKKLRRKKFMEFSSKPIVWMFAVFGWLMSLYWVWRIGLLLIEFIKNHWTV